jgi:hypothetical protein
MNNIPGIYFYLNFNSNFIIGLELKKLFLSMIRIILCELLNKGKRNTIRKNKIVI